MADPHAEGKRAAASAAADLVPDDCRLGLGTGSTVAFLLERLAWRRAEQGLSFVCVATSLDTARRAAELGFPPVELDAVEGLDLVIDGADEVDPDFDLIKGGGGALTREKIVAVAAREMLVVVSSNKVVDALGSTFALPVEVLPFGVTHTMRRVAAACGGEVVVRRDASGNPVRTDNGGLVLDARLDPHRMRVRNERHELAAKLNAIPGVVEHGLFLDLAMRVLVGHEDGSVTG
jgi:ribose 5-phosphate isomerase A